MLISCYREGFDSPSTHGSNWVHTRSSFGACVYNNGMYVVVNRMNQAGSFLERGLATETQQCTSFPLYVVFWVLIPRSTGFECTPGSYRSVFLVVVVASTGPDRTPWV